jgi:ABC-type transport system involved in cytochrome bd biosynthesis fused ATPase/permease subunit
LIKSIQLDFSSAYREYYDKFDLGTRLANPYSDYSWRLDRATSIVSQPLEYWIPQTISIFENLTNISFVIARIKQPLLLVFVITMFVSVYFMVIKPLQATTKRYRKTHWANKRKLYNMSSYFNMQFQRRDIDASEMNSFEQAIQSTDMDQQDRNRIVGFPLKIVQLIILVTVIYNNQSSRAYELLLVLGSFLKFDSVYSTIIRLENSFSSAQDQFQKLTEMCVDNKYRKPHSHHELYENDQITIHSCEIQRDNLICLRDLNLGQIGTQRITRFSGKSGNGKSSLMLAIAGQVEANVRMTVNSLLVKPEQLEDHTLLVDQELTNVGIYHLSICDLFALASRRKTVNDDCVRKAMEICQIKNWANKRDWSEQIKSEISEGQKARLITSSQIYVALVNPRIKILLLDEIDGRLDKDTANQMWWAIKKELSDRIIVAISHNELDGKIFDQTYHVNDDHVMTRI